MTKIILYINTESTDVVNLFGKLVDKTVEMYNAQLLLAQLSRQMKLLSTETSNDVIELFHVIADYHTVTAQPMTICLHASLL